jgi:hypothetical protein
MKYRHERMIRARDERTRHRLQQAVEAVLRGSLTEDEARLWRRLSDAVAGLVTPKAQASVKRDSA